MKPARDPKLAWFREARFGMFVHFGVYALLGRGEWVQYHERIPRREYEKLSKRFNPSRFSAKEWVGLAADSGCRYITLTAKHHDGFCLFDSALTDYKITNTPFKRDLVGEVVAECHKQGMRICLYYSQPDWHHPNYVHLKDSFKDLSDPPADQQPDWDKYIAYYHGQVLELCRNYGRIDGIWFDGSQKSEKVWQGRKLYNAIKRLQPGAVVNDRAGFGDMWTPERTLPEDLTGYLFEACQSTDSKHWGYERKQVLFSVPTLVESLARMVAAGGNFLLNVGPRPDGTIEPGQAARMRAVGQWLKTHGEAVYGAETGGVDTQSREVLCSRKGRRLFVFFTRWPDKEAVVVPGILTKPASAVMLAGGARLKAQVTEAGLELSGLPMLPPQPCVNVARLTFGQAPKLKAPPAPERVAPVVKLSAKGETLLCVGAARPEGRGCKGARLAARDAAGLAKEFGVSGLPAKVVTNWNTNEQWLEWEVDAPKAGVWRVSLQYHCPEYFQGTRFFVEGKMGRVEAVVRGTGPRFRWLAVGALRLPKGRSRVVLRPVEINKGYWFAWVGGMKLAKER